MYYIGLGGIFRSLYPEFVEIAYKTGLLTLRVFVMPHIFVGGHIMSFSRVFIYLCVFFTMGFNFQLISIKSCLPLVCPHRHVASCLFQFRFLLGLSCASGGHRQCRRWRWLCPARPTPSWGTPEGGLGLGLAGYQVLPGPATLDFIVFFHGLRSL